MTSAADRSIPDSVPRNWVERAPEPLRPYLRLARYDRPIGFWLLGTPGLLGVALANIGGAWRLVDVAYMLLLAVGAVAMRGAGCTLNDIVDRDLDAGVARTADRPLAAGTVTVRAAWAFVLAQCFVGLLVLIALPRAAQITALVSIPLVVAYPFMKRITWFPQAWLGLTFNWAVLVGFAAAAGEIRPSVLVAYAGLAFWTFGYDTIYAHQDKEDDALVGVKSAALFFGPRSRWAVGGAYAIAFALVGLGVGYAVLDPTNFDPTQHFFRPEAQTAAIFTAATASFAFAILLIVQVAFVDFDDNASCLYWFKFNRIAIVATTALLILGPLLVELLL